MSNKDGNDSDNDKKFQIGDIVQVDVHEFKIFLDTEVLKDPKLFELIEGTRWGCLTLYLPENCGTSIMVGCESSNPTDEFIVSKIAEQFFLSTNSLLEIDNANEDIN